MTTLMFILAVWGQTSLSWGQESWPPALPTLDVPKVMLGNAVPLASEIKGGGLAFVISKNFAGLGDEAAVVRSWMTGKGDVYLQKKEGRWRLLTRDGANLLLSNPLGEILEHHNQYFGMAEATHAEIEAALLSQEGVMHVRELFEKSIRQALRVNGEVIIPEIGGEATISGGLVFHEIISPLASWNALVSEVARLMDDPRGLERLYETQPEGMNIIDGEKVLKRFLDRWPSGEAPDSSLKEKRYAILRQTVLTVLHGTADSYLLDPEKQFSAISEQTWSGRYVGIWHLHPPAFKPSGLNVEAGGELPSHDDVALAVKYGQNLTIIFVPDGFDAYDLKGVSSVGPEIFRKKISYRSPKWRQRFIHLHSEMR